MPAPRRQAPDTDREPERDPGETVHVHVKPGRTVVLGEKAFGDRATLQVSRDVAERLTESGDVEPVDPERLPDVGARPTPTG